MNYDQIDPGLAVAASTVAERHMAEPPHHAGHALQRARPERARQAHAVWLKLAVWQPSPGVVPSTNQLWSIELNCERTGLLTSLPVERHTHGVSLSVPFNREAMGKAHGLTVHNIAAIVGMP